MEPIVLHYDFDNLSDWERDIFEALEEMPDEGTIRITIEVIE